MAPTGARVASSKDKIPKTETIRKRALQVYLPSLEMVEYWKEQAKARKTSLSKFIQFHVTRSMESLADEDLLPRGELERQLADKEELVVRLEEDNRLLKSLVQRLDHELHQVRAEPFTKPNLVGTRRYDRELIDLFRRRSYIKYDELLGSLNIPTSDVQTVRGVNKQIEYLEAYGLIEKQSKGWRWRE